MMNQRQLEDRVLAVVGTGMIPTTGLMNPSRCAGGFHPGTTTLNSTQNRKRISTDHAAAAALQFPNRPPAVDHAAETKVSKTIGARTVSVPGGWLASGPGKSVLNDGLILVIAAANGTINGGAADPSDEEAARRLRRIPPRDFLYAQMWRKRATPQPTPHAVMPLGLGLGLGLDLLGPTPAPIPLQQLPPAGGLAPITINGRTPRATASIPTIHLAMPGPPEEVALPHAALGHAITTRVSTTEPLLPISFIGLHRPESGCLWQPSKSA